MVDYFNIFRNDYCDNFREIRKTLENVALLAAFIPIISGMSGNSGTQSLAVSVRNITTGKLMSKVNLELH